MSLPSSGAITLQEIQAEFGGPSSNIGLESYYRGGSYVPNISPNSGVPTSGAISLEDFYNATTGFGTVVIIAATGGNSTTYSTTYYGGYQSGGFGTLSSCSLTFATTCVNISYVTVVSGGGTSYSMTFSVSAASNPGKTAWNTMTCSGSVGGPLSSSTSTYTYGSGTASWTWAVEADLLNFTNGDSYTLTFT